MKQALYDRFTAAANEILSLRDIVMFYIPEDPTAPTGLAFVEHTDPATLLLTWDNLPPDHLAVLEVANVNLETEEVGTWNPCGIYSTKDSGTSAWATYVLPSSPGYRLQFRLSSQRNLDTVTSPPCDPITFDSPPVE